MILLILSWMALACAVSGRALTAMTTNKSRFWGFVAYVIGSLLWISYGIPSGQYALVVQNFILIGFSIIGLKNNFKNK
jgi:hypothetical protein